MIVYEIYLACLGCGQERVLGTLLAKNEVDAWDQALILHPDASIEELHVRVAAEQRSPTWQDVA